MMRSRLLVALAVAVAAGAVALWISARSDGDDRAADSPEQVGAKATQPVSAPLPPREPEPEPDPEAPEREAEPPAETLPANEEIDPRRDQPDPTPRQAPSDPEIKVGGVLKIPTDMSDERLNEILAGYDLVVTRRFKDLVRVGHKDGGDVSSAMDALANDGMFELPDRE